jgi:hypothetical protein
MVATARYGGLLFGYDDTRCRLWVPNAAAGRPNTLGSIINIGFGWGNEVNAQVPPLLHVLSCIHHSTVLSVSGTHCCLHLCTCRCWQVSHLAEVRVKVTQESSTDFDSGWFQMSSQTVEQAFMEVRHGLGQWPRRVKVVTRAQSGLNGGFAFYGVGSAMSDDDFGDVEPYGGIVFAYNNATVRLWAPSLSNNGVLGSSISIGNPVRSRHHTVTVNHSLHTPMHVPCIYTEAGLSSYCVTSNVLSSRVRAGVRKRRSRHSRTPTFG